MKPPVSLEQQALFGSNFEEICSQEVDILNERANDMAGKCKNKLQALRKSNELATQGLKEIKEKIKLMYPGAVYDDLIELSVASVRQKILGVQGQEMEGVLLGTKPTVIS